MKVWCILMLIVSVLAIIGLSIALGDIFEGLGAGDFSEFVKQMKFKDAGFLLYYILQIYGIPLILLTISLLGITRRKVK